MPAPPTRNALDIPRPMASRERLRFETPVAGRALDPAVADPDCPGGTAPALTGLTYWTEPASGRASVFSTALLGFGSVWYGNEEPRTVVGASGSAGSSKLRKVAKPEPSMTFSIRRAPRPALPAWRVPGRTRPVPRRAWRPVATAPGTS